MRINLQSSGILYTCTRSGKLIFKWIFCLLEDNQFESINQQDTRWYHNVDNPIFSSYQCTPIIVRFLGTLFNVVPSKNLTYFNKTPFIPQHKAFIPKELDFMYPDAFHTELRDSLTAVYEKILKNVCAGGCPVSKALPRKFEAAKAPVPGSVPST